MSSETPPTVGEILSARTGEEMALNDRFLNPQMGRILRTLGFGKVWIGGEGAHLIDADGERYLDLFGGYGVFAIGRNHPEAIAAVQEVMEARTGNMPQLGVTLLSGVLAEQLLSRAPGSVAAIVVEPVQGKGVNIPAADYLPGAQRLCRDAGTLFACDEVQTGIGRTGRFLALEHWELEPDIVCVAKALSGGLVPIGAVLVSRAAFDRVFDGMERAVRHGSTFGGNDLAAAAALATLRVLDREGLVARAEEMGRLLLELTEPLVERFEVVTEVRGLGLMWAIEFGPPAGAAGRRLWESVERRQPGLFSQLITLP